MLIDGAGLRQREMTAFGVKNLAHFGETDYIHSVIGTNRDGAPREAMVRIR
jgi:hypothetical protein